MASSLKSRLSRLRELGASPAGPSTAPLAPSLPPAGNDGEGKLPAFLEDWEDSGEGYFRRRLSRPLEVPERIDGNPFLATSRRPAGMGSEAAPGSTRLEVASLRFFDLETTGLSGGAGTVAFLASVGRLEGGRLLTDQLFLRDYPGEDAFLAAFLECLGPEPSLVSYNGRAYDWPLLRSRCVMNGRRPPEPLLHLDLLRTARRLWKSRLGSVPLSLVEARVLGLDRGEDIAGSRIPEIWFQYLGRGDHELMGRVASHNIEDVASLASLLAHAERAFARPFEAPPDFDRPAMGRLFLALGRREEGEGLLEAAAAEGDAEAALWLARAFRRQQRAKEARRLLALSGRGYEVAIEGARIAERLEGDLQAALESASLAASLASDEAERTRALARVRRLSLRLAAASRGRPGRTRS